MPVSHPLTLAPAPRRFLTVACAALVLCASVCAGAIPAADRVDFNRDIRRVLSENCFKCHGPDAKDRKNGKKGLRLDLQESAQADLGGRRAIAPGHPEESEMIRRITNKDPEELMPPPDSGKKLSAQEKALLRRWIEQGATYSKHWSHVKPIRTSMPEIRGGSWPKNAIDHFILARLERENLQPSPETDRAALLRRAALDLTGLPPSFDEIDAFTNDTQSDAYEKAVDRLLKKNAYGEHWARLWLDQARYADSSGYADDPARTIWAFRDYVIRSLNANKPFDQFTIEQLAGDLLEDPTDDQLAATAFHRNTMTNNEGGTNDEEYRNVAIVDRVNTTMAVWMGTTMACAQCHNHKYDPISQEDYFRLYAILNNTADADRTDESPVLSLFTDTQKAQRKQLLPEIARLEKIVQTLTPELVKAQTDWEKTLEGDLKWEPLKPTIVKSKAGATVSQEADGTVQVERGGKTDVYTVEMSVTVADKLTAFRLEALPDEKLPGRGVGHADGNFVVSRVSATITPSEPTPLLGRYLRLELPGKARILSLAEVQVFHGTENIALQGEARQSSTAYNGPAKLAIDGNTNGNYAGGKSTTHTETTADPWWELDLRSVQAVSGLTVWNRTDNSGERIRGLRMTLLNEKRETVWQEELQQVPDPSSEISLNGARRVPFSSLYASFTQKDFNAADVLANSNPEKLGWAVAPRFGEPHSLTLIPRDPVELRVGASLSVSIEQISKYEYATLGRLRLSKTSDPRASELARTPSPVLAILRLPFAQRSESQREELARYYRSIAPALKSDRDQLAVVKKQLDELKPYTTVPVLRELAGTDRRKTHIQIRGNYLNLGQEVSEGLPAAFFSLTESGPTNRLTLARWLMDENNPLTSRVEVNRLWEAIFGIGIVRTSEEFGAQGDLPSHPELLDWLATELIGSKWDIKHVLKLMVTSATYRQSSRVTPELEAVDSDNRLLARGPRFRLSAEMIRDQAMFVSGLMNATIHGLPVKPPQPKLGLSAAFGSGTDWETSMGGDQYRRALYTTWRRSNPYPSMATFDAPNREVCTVRRERSNTPLQALVTLNDPVYVEASQALARRMVASGASLSERVRHGFRLCLSRTPTETELAGLLGLYTKSLERFSRNEEKAEAIATNPLGAAPKGANIAELAAWTLVGNVLLNLDETLMKR
ncbi:MAG: DUF1553 domain-containing protein [Pedosphaera sp.]|nr:DUF1553 domain-containing protein [Pedosphaera sp.]